MKVASGALAALTEELRGRAELGLKRDIQLPARVFASAQRSAWFPSREPILNGDDAAALPDGDGYALLAAEGMRPELVAADPWFAGFCSVMVNLSDVAAMGGRPWAVVDALFMGSGENERVLEGMKAASELFGVPVVGGHTARVDGPTLLSVAVLGRAQRLISSHAAKPGQTLLMAVDLRGSFRLAGAFNAATTASAQQLRAGLAVLPELAEAGLVGAGKDISMAGTCGSLAMLLETSGVGARLELSRVPAPLEVDPLRWLTAFPSYGFVLTAEQSAVAAICARFDRVGVACAAVGTVDDTKQLRLEHAGESALYLDLSERPLTGFGASP
ncbi:MAG: sll0787 family AIR synthase-like protein [Myxococcales bacterium]|nr:MAG: sll0787 family AIR synthase-like protein [Myxococcales bacterium]